ncbi:MAG: DUF1926 domain-containing protein, partial [Deferribacterales bacterium]
IKLTLLADKFSESFIYKVNTVHQSEQGVDFTTQGIAVLFPIKFQNRLNFQGSITISEVK